MDPVPVTGLAANFSPIPRMAPPPFGRLMAGGEIWEGWPLDEGVPPESRLGPDASLFCMVTTDLETGFALSRRLGTAVLTRAGTSAGSRPQSGFDTLTSEVANAQKRCDHA